MKVKWIESDHFFLPDLGFLMGLVFPVFAFGFFPFAGFLAGDEGLAGEVALAGDFEVDLGLEFLGFAFDVLGFAAGFLAGLGLLAALLD